MPRKKIDKWDQKQRANEFMCNGHSTTSEFQFPKNLLGCCAMITPTTSDNRKRPWLVVSWTYADTSWNLDYTLNPGQPRVGYLHIQSWINWISIKEYEIVFFRNKSRWSFSEVEKENLLVKNFGYKSRVQLDVYHVIIHWIYLPFSFLFCSCNFSFILILLV